LKRDKIALQETATTSDSDSSDEECAGFGIPGTLSAGNKIQGFGSKSGSKGHGKLSNCQNVKHDTNYSHDNGGEGLNAPRSSLSTKENNEADRREQDRKTPHKCLKVEDDGWSSDEEEELKAALANRDIELAQKLMQKEEDEPSAVKLSQKDEKQRARDCHAKKPDANQNVDSEDTGLGGAEALRMTSGMLDNSVVTIEEQEQFDNAPSCRQKDEPPSDSHPAQDKGFPPDEIEGLKAAFAVGEIEEAQGLFKKSEIIDQVRVTAENQPKNELEAQSLLGMEEVPNSFDDTENTHSRTGDEQSTMLNDGRGGRYFGSSSTVGDVGSLDLEEAVKNGAIENLSTNVTTSVIPVRSTLGDMNQTALVLSSVGTEEGAGEAVVDVINGSRCLSADKELATSNVPSNDKRNLGETEALFTVVGPPFSSQASTDTNAETAAVYQPVHFEGYTGRLVLESEHLCFEPFEGSQTSDFSTTIPWSCVAKQQASPAKVDKALLKIILTDGKTVLFRVNDRTILGELQRDTERRLAFHSALRDADPKDLDNNEDDAFLEFRAVRFKSAVGSLLLLKHLLVFKPTESNAETEASKLTLSWIEVLKHQVTPSKHAKSLLKLTLSSGKSLTFEFEDRGALVRARKGVTSMLRDYQMISTNADESRVESQSQYNPVIFRSMVGSMVLGKESLVYTPTNATTNGTTDDPGGIFTLCWDEVAKHKVSPETHEKPLLKFLLHSGKALTFTLESRVDLMKARKAISQLLRDSQSDIWVNKVVCIASWVTMKKY
jgi:hypothetical protein